MTGLTPFNPDSWMDVVALVVIGLLGLAATVVTVGLPLWMAARKAAGTTATQVAEIHTQTVNDHPKDDPDANMRTQLDRMDSRLADVLAHLNSQGRDIRGIREDIGGIRGEVRDDRADLRDLEKRIATFVAREHPGAPPV